MRDLIVSVLMDEASAGEQRVLERWRNESPENERLYQEFIRSWLALSVYPSQEPVTLPPPVEQIVAAGNLRRRKATPLGLASRKPSTTRWWTLVATAAATLLIAGLSVFRYDPPELTVATGIGETKTAVLADGSVVRLGPNSRLAFWNGNRRRVEFSGLGFFAVTSDSAKPFVVRTGVGTAEVLGTRFEIRASEDSLRLVVVDGRVALAASDYRVEVPGGEMTWMFYGEPPSIPVAVDVWSVMDWEEGLLLFQNTSLADVTAELERFFGVAIQIPDAALRRRVVTAWFEREALDDVLETICRVVGATCTLGDSVVMAP